MTDGVSTHSRPKAAGVEPQTYTADFLVSTHSRPKAAGGALSAIKPPKPRFNSQPPEGGWQGLENQNLA